VRPEAVRGWVEGAAIAGGPVFRSVANGGRVLVEALTDRSVANIAKT
jgi:hypothetical protein